MKLQIICIVEDDKIIPPMCYAHFFAVVNTSVFYFQIGMDFLEEEITAFEEYIQSVDVVAFNKL